MSAINHIAAHASENGADTSQGFIVGGHSMDASMAAIVSLHAKAFGVSAKISGLYLGAGAFITDRLPN